jgi:hypothetical protein
MSVERPSQTGGDAPLNPGLHREIDASHGTEFKGTDPMATVSVRNPDEGRSWPMIWAAVAVACLLIAIYYVLA